MEAETITINDVYSKISKIEKKMLTKEELLGYLETFEIMSNSETMESIRKSREDIKKGRFKKIENVHDMLSEIK